MPATPRRLEFTAKDLAGPPEHSGGTYSEIVVPGDFEITLASVDDYDYTDRGKSKGWIFLYQVATSTGPCDFSVYLSFGKGARWKIGDVFLAHGIPANVGIENVDPNLLVGQVIGGHLDYGVDRTTGEPTQYREIKEFFPLVSAPASAEAEDEAPFSAGDPEVL